MKNYYDLLSSGTIKLFAWGKYRWFESFIALNFLNERYDDAWIRELAQIIDGQGFDYSEIEYLWESPLYIWKYETHIVNMGMLLKIEAVTDTLLNGKYKGLAKKQYDKLKKYNGTPTGTFTGDECLAGLSPIHGTELCAVAEEMYSAELLYAATGDQKWAEILELVTFNALPATLSDDMWTHQYDQMSNQIATEKFKGKSFFGTNGPSAHIFGVEPNYGCCTANFNQAWPKFALSTFMKDGDNIISVISVPSKVEYKGAIVELSTEYPFKNKLTYTVNTNRAFKLSVRIPEYAESIIVNGNPSEKKDIIDFYFCENDSKIVEIEIIHSAKITDRPHDLKTVQYGNLIFSLPIKAKEARIEYTDRYEHKYPYCDFEFTPESEWKYGYVNDELTIEEHNIDYIPFSSFKPAITITANVSRIDWEYEEGYDTIAAKLPKSRRPLSSSERVSLYPYGCAKLRMTEIPFVEE